MYIIDVKISDDRFVKCENIFAGQTGENNITKLKFTVPEVYKDFYKYLDIIKSDGKKTQTVVADMGNNVFYYTLPFSLTVGEEITLQLIMKKEEKVFKSNIFVLHFNGSIDGTQKLVGDYQDTIQFLMENKASKEEAKELNDKLAMKVDKSEYYNFYLKTNEELNKKVSNADFLTFKNGNINKLNLKVDKKDGKGLSEEDYTTEEKNKLKNLPTSAELNEEFDGIRNTLYKKTDKTTFDEYKNNTNNALKGKVDNSVYSEDKSDITRDLGFCGSEIIRLQSELEAISQNIGDIDSALDELHNYAQALIVGGVS